MTMQKKIKNYSSFHKQKKFLIKKKRRKKGRTKFMFKKDSRIGNCQNSRIFLEKK